MNEGKGVDDQHSTATTVVPDLQHPPKQEFEHVTRSVPILPTPSATEANSCESITEGFCQLPTVTESDVGNENTTGDICLESESFLQSLESIPLPSAAAAAAQHSENGLYVPVASFSELYSGLKETKHLPCSAAVQQEIMPEWGNAGPPRNSASYLDSSLMQGPYTASANAVSSQHCSSRGGRGRGRGRRLRKKIIASHVQFQEFQEHIGASPQAPFSPRFMPMGPHAGYGPAAISTASAPNFVPRPVHQMLSPSQFPQTSHLNMQDVISVRQAMTSDCPSSETLLGTDVNQVNEKINAYIEKFSGNTAETFGPTLTVDTSHKPSTLQEAITMYIDFIILENEKRTRISCCNVVPVPLDFHKEDYYHEIMCQPVTFPTPKFREWLKLYNVDIEITDPDGQTVSQTTFPPSTNFSDGHASIHTSMPLLKWQTNGTNDLPHPMHNPGLGFNMANMFRGRQRGRFGTGGHPPSRLTYSAFMAVDNRPTEFTHNGVAVSSHFQRSDRSGSGVVDPTSPCGNNMHQFQTIGLPTLGAIQCLGQTAPVNVHLPFHDTSTINSLQATGSFQNPSAASSSNFHTMAPVLSTNVIPSSKEIPWRESYSRSNMNMINTENGNMPECVKKSESFRNVDSAFLAPSVINMLPPFQSFVSHSGADSSSEIVNCYLPTQTTESFQKTSEITNSGPGDISQNFMDFPRDKDSNVSSLPLILKSDNIQVIDFVGDGQFSSAQPQNCGHCWSNVSNDGTSVPVFKEMVDQGSQTEIDEMIENITGRNTCRTAMQDTKSEHQGFRIGLDEPSFLRQSSTEDGGRNEDEINSEILLRNASIILNGSLEIVDSIRAGMVGSSNILSNSQTSNLSDLNGIGQPVDCNTSVNLSCTSESLDVAEMPGSLKAGGSSEEYNVTASDNIVNKPTDIVLEVASNVEIDSEENQTAEENSDDRWIEPECKRARFDKVTDD